MENNKDPLKPLFVQRLGAIIIDIILVSLVASFISSFFIDNDAIMKLSNSMMEIYEKYMNAEISASTVATEGGLIMYQLAQKQGILVLVTIFLEILYFMVYQFKNDGQTIGKKIFKIKVVRNDGEELTMNNLVFRSLIINSVLVDMICFAFLIFGNAEVYFFGASMFEFLSYTIIIASIFMIMWNKSGRGIHDYIANTKVIRN